MSKRYFIIDKTDRWTTHAEQAHTEGVAHENVDDIPVEPQTVNVENPDGSVNTKQRLRKRNSSIGLESQDVHFKGDRVVITREEVDPSSGDINMYFDRYSDSGRRTGSYVVPWFRVGEDRHAKGTPRRIFT